VYIKFVGWPAFLYELSLKVLERLNITYNQYGPVFKYNLLGFEIAIAGDPESAEHMLKTKFHNYIKGPLLHDLLSDLLGDGIFAVDGDLWHSQRKIASHLFATKTLKTLMFDTFLHHAKSVNEIISKQKKNIELQDLFYRFTFDCIGNKKPQTFLK
jgi:cytochrome P450